MKQPFETPRCIPHQVDRCVLYVIAALLAVLLGGNKILNAQELDPQQQPWVPHYSKQENAPKPEEMLLNTDAEPELTVGFTSLFNGKDLTGWEPRGGTCTFDVKDGKIVGTCAEGSNSTYLSTKRNDFRDFVFTCELKLEVDGNTGVQFRSQSKQGKKEGLESEVVFGPQLEIEGQGKPGRNWSGGIYGQSCGGYFYPLWLKEHAAARAAEKKTDWNRVTISCRGNVTKTWMNGVSVSHWVGDGTYSQGFFALQVHKGKAGTIQFKNLRVKELPAVVEKTQKKNVLFFHIDDLRPELACYGEDYIQSPHIDSLAAQGTLFERAYCQQAICAPSRASMMAGQYPDSLGIYDLGSPLRRTVPDVMSMPRYFQGRGYETSSFGKVYHHHIDDKKFWTKLPDEPNETYAKPATLDLIQQKRADAKKRGLTGLDVYRATQGPAAESFEVKDAAYRDGAVADQAIAALQASKDKPFFMCVGFAKPHLPFAAPKRYWDLYKREQFSVPDRKLPDGTPKLAVTKWGELRAYTDIPAEGPLTDEQTLKLKHGYAACVSFADAQVGKVLAELDRLGLRENTIVVLWGDHGYKLGDYGLWCKHTNLELDTRVPLVVSAPGLAKGQRSKSLVEMVDVFPTLAKLTGGQIPESCDGKSLEEVLAKPDTEIREFAISQYPRGQTMGYSLRNNRWRYTEWINMKTEKTVARELYDHQSSSLTKQNLANDPSRATMIAKLSKQLDAAGRIKTVATSKQ